MTDVMALHRAYLSAEAAQSVAARALADHVTKGLVLTCGATECEECDYIRARAAARAALKAWSEARDREPTRDGEAP